MTIDNKTQDVNPEGASVDAEHDNEHALDIKPEGTDGLVHKKPEELTPEELRLMADTMPGDGPGD